MKDTPWEVIPGPHEQRHGSQLQPQESQSTEHRPTSDSDKGVSGSWRQRKAKAEASQKDDISEKDTEGQKGENFEEETQMRSKGSSVKDAVGNSRDENAAMLEKEGGRQRERSPSLETTHLRESTKDWKGPQEEGHDSTRKQKMRLKPPWKKREKPGAETLQTSQRPTSAWHQAPNREQKQHETKEEVSKAIQPFRKHEQQRSDTSQTIDNAFRPKRESPEKSHNKGRRAQDDPEVRSALRRLTIVPKGKPPTQGQSQEGAGS